MHNVHSHFAQFAAGTPPTTRKVAPFPTKPQICYKIFLLSVMVQIVKCIIKIFTCNYSPIIPMNILQTSAYHFFLFYLPKILLFDIFQTYYLDLIFTYLLNILLLLLKLLFQCFCFYLSYYQYFNQFQSLILLSIILHQLHSNCLRLK